MQNNRLIAIGIIVFGLLVLIGVVWFMFLAPVPPPEAPAVAPADNGTAGDPAALPATGNTPITPPRTVVPVRREPTEADVRRLAASVVERYGSYSNQAGYRNLRDLEVFMSRSMQERTAEQVRQLLAANADTSLYYGITTKSVVSETMMYEPFAGRAQFRIETQREEATGSANNVRSFRQTAVVDMALESGAWKVDAIRWE